MKLPGFEGTSKEFDNLVVNHGFKAEQFLLAPEKEKFNPWFFIVLSILFVILNCIIYAISIDGTILKVLTVLDFVLLVGTVICFHLTFNKTELTIFLIIGMIAILSFCLGFSSTKETIDKLEKASNKFENKKE